MTAGCEVYQFWNGSALEMLEKDNSPSALPIYQQVSEFLTREIAAGRLLDGQRLAPERTLAAQHGITVRTLRKALLELERRGMLDRVHGSGNYVRTTKDVQSIYSLFRLELHAGGGLPTAQLLDITEQGKPADLPPFGGSSRATRIRRLRRLNQIPVAIEEIWLDRSFGAVHREDISDSLYRYYQQKLGFWITRVSDKVRLARVPEWKPAAFDPSPGSPAGFVERLSWAQADVPVEYSRTWFDPTRANYVQRIS